MIKQYRVTYDSIDKISVVNRLGKKKENMEFNIHEYGLHCYNRTNNAVVLINKVHGNKQEFYKIIIIDAEQEKLCIQNLDIHQLKIPGGFFRANKS